MTAQIIVTNVWSRIRGLKDLTTIDALDRITSFYVEGYQFTKAFKEGYYDKKQNKFVHWDGKKHLLNQRMVFPTGLLERVKGFLDRYKEKYEVLDQRNTPKLGKPLEIKGYKPRSYQQEAVDIAFNKGRGIIRIGTGGGKCPRIGTKVIKYDGTICKVEELIAGDLLMGPDSKPRRVLSTNKQYGNIVKIIPKRGDPWHCNDIHILTLKHTITNEIIDISIPEYNKQHKKFKHCYKQFSIGVEFPKQEEELPVAPYFLGIWFGDGNKYRTKTSTGMCLSNVGISNIDKEIVDYLYRYADKQFCKIRKTKQTDGCPTYFFKAKYNGEPNRMLNNLRSLVGENVEIPQAYLTSSRKDRLEFLAGLIDSDGHLHNNCYEICQKRKDWADDIAFLARSLGFKVTIGLKHNKKYDRNYYRLGISGNISKIPVRIERKKAGPRRQKKDPCKTGFKIEPAGQDYYIGIELDGDGRFLLGDFTVTHNTLVASMITAKYNVPTMVYVVGKDLLYQFHREMQKSLGVKIGIIGDGQCQIEKVNVCSVWTAATAFNLNTKVSLDDEDWAPEILSIGNQDKAKIRFMIENTNLSIFDEAHFLATDTLQSIFKASKKCAFLFGLSGTDWRDDGADLLLESVCGERIYNMPSSKLIEEGFLVPPNIALLEVPPYHEPLPSNYPSVYSKYITKNDIRNGMIIDSARKLIEKGKKVLILVRYISHGNEIAEQLSDLPIYFVNGEVDGQTRISVRTDFESGQLKCLIASSVFDIGIDIPSLDVLILAGGGKSTVRTLQRIGRVIRSFKGKKSAIVVDFIDNAKFLDKHSATRIAVYETEEMFRIKFPKNFDRAVLKNPDKIVRKIK